MNPAYDKLQVNYHGLFLSPMSWAQVNREMALAMDRLGCRVGVIANRGFCYQADFPLPKRLRQLRSVPPGSQWDVAFEYPLNYDRLQADHKAGLLVYETTELPPLWAEAICRHLDLLAVPSTFCREVALEAGVPLDRIVVIPYGYDPERFYPCSEPRPRQGRFIFLCLAMPHLRKGIRELVQAFQEEFSPDEPVGLVVKLPYLLKGGPSQRPWELEGLDPAAISQASVPGEEARIQFIHRADPPGQMPLWFRFCDAYVQASYGEGFGLSILEAKATGKPTLVTGWGGHMDFCTHDNSFLVDYELIPAGKAQYDHCSPSARCARPLVASLRKQMRRVFQDQAEAAAKVKRSLRDIRCLTWENAARNLLDALLERM